MVEKHEKPAYFFVRRSNGFDIIYPGSWESKIGDSYFPEFICHAESEQMAMMICQSLNNK